jgi:hypothetical protein
MGLVFFFPHACIAYTYVVAAHMAPSGALATVQNSSDKLNRENWDN